MADTKISALPASTLPLAGTEVLPIVQSSITKKIATDDLTVKNIRSNATNGILQIVGPAASATRVMTTPDANFTAARLDAAQSFTGNQTLSTGNLIVGTAGNGIDFSADPAAAGMTSELLDDYEEGTWAPVDQSGAGLTFTVIYATYTKIGRAVSIQGAIQYPLTASALNASFAGLPFNAANSIQLSVIYSDASVASFTYLVGTTTAVLALTPGVNVTNAALSEKFVTFAGTYFV